MEAYPLLLMYGRTSTLHVSIKAPTPKGRQAMSQMKGFSTPWSLPSNGRWVGVDWNAGGPTRSVQPVPFHQRKQRGSAGSGYHPGAVVTW